MSEPTYLAILVLLGVAATGVVKTVEHDKAAPKKAEVQACSMCGQPDRSSLLQSPAAPEKKAAH